MNVNTNIFRCLLSLPVGSVEKKNDMPIVRTVETIKAVYFTVTCICCGETQHKQFENEDEKHQLPEGWVNSWEVLCAPCSQLILNDAQTLFEKYKEYLKIKEKRLAHKKKTMTDKELNKLILSCEELIQKGQQFEAQTQLEMAVAISNEKYLPLYALSGLYFKKGDYEKALLYSKKAIDNFVEKGK